ncbi:MAG TPA: PD-(D/E)XK nuclease family protein [Mucilaginibacter sp.]
MPELSIYNQNVSSVFELLGQKENDISYAVGFLFSRCETFLKLFLKELNNDIDFQPNLTKIRLQQHEHKSGFTDFEIVQEGKFHIIVEAKRGWNFPTDYQLNKYAGRLSYSKSLAHYRQIVVFNESTLAYVRSHFKPIISSGENITVISWRSLAHIAKQALNTRKLNEKYLLNQLIDYLDKISTMQKVDSNWVYVVSLGNVPPPQWKFNWQDVVTKYSRYFHPVGGTKGGWPKEPPNYIAFRYNGRLQSIHHIDNYEVMTNPNAHFKEIPDANWSPHYLYTLGQAIRPNKVVKTGKQVTRSMRVWAMLDLLLTSETIGEARDKSKQRSHNL